MIPGRETADQLPTVRAARVDEAGVLTLIARRAKASWGYPEEWLRAWEEALTITPEYVERNRVFVAVRDSEPVGVGALERGGNGPEVGHLWVVPEAHGLGVGRALMKLIALQAREDGYHELRIESDPNAVSFYERIGAKQVGKVAAPVAGHDRFLPVLSLVL